MNPRQPITLPEVLAYFARVYGIQNFAPNRIEKPVQATVIEEDLRDCACKCGDYDANKQDRCDGCIEEEKRLFAEEDQPEPLHDESGRPTGTFI